MPISYEQYRTGLTFGAVSQALHVEARGVFEREGRRMFITRRTVLGRWHQIKRESYAANLRHGSLDTPADNAPTKRRAKP